MSNKPKKKMGRPTHKPDAQSRAVVAALVKYGVAQEFIAMEIGVAKDTLRKHYKDILDLVTTEMKDEAVKQSLYYSAVVRKNVKAQMFWLERRCPKEWGMFKQDNSSDDLSQAEVMQAIFAKLPN
jgi:hypothetical protein